MAYLTPISGPPSDNLGVQGDVVLDYTGRFQWGPKGATSWVGTAKSLVGPTGPALSLPVMINQAAAYFPGCQFNGQTMGTSTTGSNIAFSFNGSPIPNTFTPPQNTALVGLGATNFGSTGATVYFYLQDLTTNTALYGYNSGNGIAAGTVGSVSFTNTQFPMIAGHTYQWQGIRGTAGATTMQINPIYLTPANGTTALSTFQPFAITSSTTAATNGTVFMPGCGIPGQTGYYRNSNPSYLYSVELFVQGTGTPSPFMYNGSTSANQWADAPALTISSTQITRFTFGPFPATRWPFTANQYYQFGLYGAGGAINITSAYAIITVGQ